MFNKVVDINNEYVFDLLEEVSYNHESSSFSAITLNPDRNSIWI